MMKGLRERLTCLLIGVFSLSFPLCLPAQEEPLPQTDNTTEEPVLSKDSKAQATKPSDQGGQENLTVVLGGKPPYLYDSSVQVDPYTGSVSTSIPITVPQGRNGIQPNLQIFYNSSQPNGMFGIGWGMELGAIQRSTKKGVPAYDASDTFILIQSGSSQELVFDSAQGIYRPEIESGAFMKIEKLGNTWLATDKKGVKYYFGQTQDSQEFHPDDSSLIFKWCLDRVEDQFGNYMTISYTRPQYANRLYPNLIFYTGNSQDPVIPLHAHIQFDSQLRDDITTSYISGFPQKTDRRIHQINVLVNAGTDVNPYQFGYSYSPDTGRSILTSVTQRGSDWVSTLPSTIFQYTEGAVNFGGAIGLGTTPNLGLDSRKVRAVDMNGDGLSDILQAEANNYQIFLNQGGLLFVDGPGVANPPNVSGDNPDMRFVDFNADGLLDVVIGDGSGCPGNPYRIWLNNGQNGFQPPRTVSNCPNHSISYNNWTQFVDMNADSFIDIVDAQANRYSIYFNNGNADFASEYIATNSIPFGTETPDVQFVDFTADGVLDVIFGNGSCPGSPYKIWVNNRTTGFLPPKTISQCINHSISYQNLLSFVDMNGDGLTDMVDSGNGLPYRIYFNTGSVDFIAPLNAINSPIRGTDNSNVKWVDLNADGLLDVLLGQPSAGILYQASINNGVDGFMPAYTPGDLPNTDLDDNMVALGDITGDSLPEFIRGAPPGFPYRAFANMGGETASRKVDILKAIDNSIGGVTSIEYSYQPINGLTGYQFKTAYSPVLFNTVKKTILSDGQGDAFETSYSYQNGVWNNLKREFRGFGMVKTIDPDGNYSVVNFAQDDIKKGRPLDQSAYDSSNNLFGKTVNAWNFQALAPGVNFVFLERVDNFVYDGNASGRRTAALNTFGESPQYGNLTKAEQLGEVNLTTGEDIGTDKRTVENEYHNVTTGNYLLGIPKRVTAKDNALSLMRQSWFFYDNNPDWNQVPTQGLLTKKEDWNGFAQGDVNNPKAQYSYDSYGNLLTTTDPKGNTTTIAYDSNYHIFPLSTQNALTHTAVNEYYGVNGVPLDSGDGYKGLWGQAKSSMDPNNQTVKTTYDTFGRPTATVSPLDSIDFPTTTTEYTFGSTYAKIKIHQRIKHAQPATVDGVQYFDGLGRSLQSKSVSETPGQYIVSGQTEYNSRGLPEKQYLSRFTSNDLDTMDLIDSTTPKTIISYDSMGRVIQTTNPDGTYSSVQYNDWTIISTDENGHMMESDFDAYGRLIQKREYLGADGRGAPEYPQTSGSYKAYYTLYAQTQYVYDSGGNLSTVIDAKGNTTSISYDKLGRKINMADPDMGTWQYSYDLNGNLKWQVDNKGQRIDFTYDALNRLTNKTDLANLNVNYTYDNLAQPFTKGRLTKAQYQADDTQFQYDQLGREVQSNKTINGANFTIQRNYDAVNRLINVQYPDQKNVFYKYNAAGQIEAISNDESLFGGSAPMTGTGGSGSPQPVIQIQSSPDHHSKLNIWGRIKQWITSFDLSWIETYLFGVSVAEAAPSNYEDFLTFTLSNPAGNVTRTSDYITFTDIQTRDTNAFAFKDFVIIGDLFHQVDTRLWRADANSGYTVVWGISDTISRSYDQWANGILVSFYKNSTDLKLILSKRINGVQTTVDSSIPLVLNTRYYLNITRTGSNVTVAVYSNSARTTLVDTLQGVVSLGSLRYFYGFSVRDINSTGKRMSGDVGRLKTLSAPTLISATAGNGEVALNWSAVNYVTGYKIYYGTSSLNYPQSVDAGNGTSFTVNNLTNGTTYYFALTSYNAASESGYSNERSATPQGPPVPPTLNTPIASNGQIQVNWTSISGATGYRLKYGTTSGTYPNIIEMGNTTSYTLNGLTNDVMYYLAVSSYNANGESVPSNEQSAMPRAVNSLIFEQVNDANGIVAMESEHFNSTLARIDRWQYIARSGASGTGAMEAVPNDGSVYNTGYVINSPQMDYKINFTKTGTHYIWVRGYARSDADDTVHAGLDGAGTSTSDRINGFTLNTWKWSKSTMDAVPATVQIATAGVHTINLWMREDGFIVDKIVITTNASYTPSGSGPAESERVDYAPAIPVLNEPVAADTSVSLNWNPSPNATGYKVKYGTAPGSYDNTMDVGNVTSHNVASLTNGTAYYFVVSAYNSYGESLNSNEVSATPFTEDPTLYVSNVDYNQNGQITRIEYGNGVVTTYEYDPLNLRLMRLRSLDPLGMPIQDLSYTYDSVGNILTITDVVHTATQSFQYDELNRLVYAQGSYGEKFYAYDEIGNIMEKDGKTYTYGENPGCGGTGGQSCPHAVTSLSDGTTFSYDANGNMINKTGGGVPSTDYIYDVENRLVEVRKNAGRTAQYEYDGDGGRTKKVTYGSSTSVTTFVGSLYEESGFRETKYIFLGGTRIASVTNGAIMYYHADHLGGTNVLSDNLGTLKELIEYEPYGQYSRHEKYGSSEEIAWFYFTGKKLDDETGLYYFGARYYDSSLGKFITPDLVVPRPGNPQAFNRYSYASNNPVTYLEDGNGWFIPFIIAAIKGAAIGAAVGAGTAAITGGDVGKGALFGAIGGGVFAGLSSGFSSLAKFAMTGTTNVSLIGSAAGAVNILGTAFAGAGAGAAMAGVNGSDVGLGALAGLAGSAAGYLGAYHLAPSAGHIFGSLASAAVTRNDLDRAAYLGFLDSSVATTIEFMIPQPTIGEQGTPEGGDLIFYKGGLDPSGLLLSVLQGSPIAHNAIAKNATQQIDSHVDGGVDIRPILLNRSGRLVKWAGTGNKKFVDLAVQYGKTNAFQYWLGSGREVCSTFCARVATETGLAIPGFSPASQYHNIQNIPSFSAYGVQRP